MPRVTAQVTSALFLLVILVVSCYLMGRLSREWWSELPRLSPNQFKDTGPTPETSTATLRKFDMWNSKKPKHTSTHAPSSQVVSEGWFAKSVTWVLLAGGLSSVAFFRVGFSVVEALVCGSAIVPTLLLGLTIIWLLRYLSGSSH